MRGSGFGSRRSATLMLLIANTVAFVVECLVYGYPPDVSRGPALALSWGGLSQGYLWQLLTYQFLHANLLHLIFNCWAIYAFGRDLEEALGVRRFLTLYLLSGVAGGLCQALLGGLVANLGAPGWGVRFLVPTVGASAGALGLLAAFATLYPERLLTWLLFLIIPVTMRAKFLLLFSVLLALFGLLIARSNMADAAHLGGIAFGVWFIRYALQWNWTWPKFRLGSRASAKRLVKVNSGPGKPWHAKPDEENTTSEEFFSREVDTILDKISAQGIQSLTDRERRVLEAARERMGKR
jgi:membrane associated rhomboid family serine protease